MKQDYLPGAVGTLILSSDNLLDFHVMIVSASPVDFVIVLLTSSD